MDANKICPGVVQRYVCGMDVSVRQKPQTEVREETYDQTTKKLQFDFTNATYRLCLRGYLGLPEQTPFSLLCDITIFQKPKKKKQQQQLVNWKFQYEIFYYWTKRVENLHPFSNFWKVTWKEGNQWPPIPPVSGPSSRYVRDVAVKSVTSATTLIKSIVCFVFRVSFTAKEQKSEILWNKCMKWG